MKKMMMPTIAVAAIAMATPNAVIGMVFAEGDTESMLKNVNQQLETLNSDIKNTAEDALKQAKRSGEVSDETKKTADQLLTNQTQLTNSVKELTEKLEGVASQTLEISQGIAAGSGRGSGTVQSLGQAFVGHGDQVANYKGGTTVFSVNNAITSTSAGGLMDRHEETAVVGLSRRRLLVRDLLGAGRTTAEQIHYRKQVIRTSGAGTMAEGAPSSASNFTWAKGVERVKKIGSHINISEEALADAAQLESSVDGELSYLVELEEEKQIVAGDGVNENFSGLVTQAAAFAAAAGLPNSTRIDRLRLAFLQLTLEDYMPSEVLLNPTDWAGIELLKVGSSDDRYIFGNPSGQSTPKLWAKDVVETNTMSAGEFLAGDLAMAATYYQRSDTEFTLSDSHDENFISDMITLKARRRAALVVKRSLAMVKGNFVFA